LPFDFLGPGDKHRNREILLQHLESAVPKLRTR